VLSRTCPRCHSDLPDGETGTLTYCPHCGAAQVELSEELREQFEQQQAGEGQPGDAAAHIAAEGQLPVADPGAVLWPRVLQLVVLAAACFGPVVLLMHALAPLVLIVLLWLLGAPIILLGVYCAKHPKTRVTTGFGSRLGLLSGLAVGSAFVAGDLLGILMERFVLHRGAELDAQFSSTMDQIRTMWQQMAPNDPAMLAEYNHYLQIFQIPEFHVGVALAGCAAMIALYAAYSTLAGAFSGLLRSRSATR
jgi:predicted RNA-binding Zn-ribbon protein involved in translation (DUF1610 family)